MKAACIEGPLGSRAQPCRIIYSGRRITIRHNGLRMHPSLIAPNLYGSYHTQLTALYKINSIFKMLLAALPLTGLNYLIITLLGSYHRAAFNNGITYRLFNINIF